MPKLSNLSYLIAKLNNYCNLKRTSTLCSDLTFTPPLCAGCHLGILETILNASSFKYRATGLFKRIFVRLPSSSTVKTTVTVPCIPFSAALAGYLMVEAINLLIADSPPMNCAAVGFVEVVVMVLASARKSSVLEIVQSKVQRPFLSTKPFFPSRFTLAIPYENG